MCGLTGVSFKDESLLNKSLNSISHRGPDGKGTFFSDSLSLGHVLLSIRADVKESIQPVKQENVDWVLAFNGQIYNLSYLKTLLPKDSIDTDLDTRILYELVKVYGWDFINYIDGMFSIFLMNTKTQEIRLYRDESGQKPLYYYFDGKNLFFSSEIKGMLAMGINRKIDKEAISFYAHLGYLPGSDTIFSNIKKVLPSEVITFNREEGRLEFEKINNFRKNPDSFIFNDIKEDIISLLDLHLQSKTKVCLNLSGGMDSSSLLWAAKQSGRQLGALTTYFLDAPKAYNEEVLLAKDLCKSLNIEHNILEVSQKDFLDNFIDAYQTLEEPNGNVAIPLYLITAKEHKQENNTVVISGDGGDETWGGYNHHFKSYGYDSQLFPGLLKFKFQNIIKRKAYLNISNPIERYLYLRASVSSFSENRFNLLKKYLKDQFSFLKEFQEFKQLSTTQQMFCIERMTWLSEENFMRSDKIYMSQGLEVRSPFAYTAFRNDFNRKFDISDLWSEGFNKFPLRSSLNKKMINSINWRKTKVGWKAPLEEKWYDNKFKEIFMDIFDRNSTDNVKWRSIRDLVYKTQGYPGKLINYYASLAIISDMYKVEI